MSASMNTNDQGSAVLQHEDNPLRQKMTSKQFDASVKFYEADHRLTKQDRLDLSKDLQDVVFKSSLIGYLSGIGNFFLPTIIDRFRSKKAGAVANQGRFQFPRIQKPFFSFFLGLSTMMFMHQLVSKYQFSKNIERLEADSSKSRQVEVWKAMDYHLASLFYLYYRKTAQNPSFTIKDPRSFTLHNVHEVHYDPPSKNTHFTKALGIGDESMSQNSNLSHWDRIRLANGFYPTESTSDNESPEFQSNESDPFLSNPNDDTSASVNTPTQESNTKKTAWDRIREGSGK